MLYKDAGSAPCLHEPRAHLEVNQMASSHAKLDSIIESVHKTMLSARQFKNDAALRNLTIFKTVNSSRIVTIRYLLHR